MNKYKNCYISLKGGILKSYYFTDEFINEHNELFNELEKIWDKFYCFDCCVYGASKTNKNNNNLKLKLCDTLDKFYDLNIKIFNGFDNKKYKTKESYKKYILNYGM